MLIWTHITHQLHEIREFVVPSYHPERHYMRGPGPACARRFRERLSRRSLRPSAAEGPLR